MIQSKQDLICPSSKECFLINYQCSRRSYWLFHCTVLKLTTKTVFDEKVDHIISSTFSNIYSDYLDMGDAFILRVTYNIDGVIITKYRTQKCALRENKLLLFYLTFIMYHVSYFQDSSYHLC